MEKAPREGDRVREKQQSLEHSKLFERHAEIAKIIAEREKKKAEQQARRQEWWRAQERPSKASGSSPSKAGGSSPGQASFASAPEWKKTGEWVDALGTLVGRAVARGMAEEQAMQVDEKAEELFEERMSRGEHSVTMG